MKTSLHILSHRLPSAFNFALLVGLAAFTLTCFSPAILNDGDTYWHIRAGQWMISQRAVLRHDPFSYTFANAPWHTQEWLAEIIMAWAFKLGWPGVHLLFALAASASAGILSYYVRTRTSFVVALLGVVLGLGCISPSLLARPHILALPLLMIWTVGLTSSRERRTRPSGWLLPVMTLWANLHASFVFGLALVAGLGLEASLDARNRKQVVLEWACFSVLALGAALLTPYTLEGLLFPLRLNFMPALAHIGEWQKSDFSHFSPFEAALVACVFLVASSSVRIPLIRLLILSAIAYLAIAHARHQMLFGAVVPILLAPFLAKTWPNEDKDGNAFFALLISLSIMPVAGLRLMMPIERHDDRMSPMSALAHVPPSLRALPVLNDYSYGGYLIFNHVRPFIDSRADLFGEKFLEQYGLMTESSDSALAQTLHDYGIAWTIFPLKASIVKRLDTMAGWRRYYADKFAIIHVRETVKRS